MSPEVEIIYPKETSGSLEGLLEGLADKAREPLPFNFSERLAALQALSDALLGGKHRSMPGVAFLAAFLRSANLTHLLNREIANLDALDQFIRLEDRKSLRILPKGLVAHWIAGNVPLLGMFSWVLSALVGNTNVIRLSTRGDEVISSLVAELAKLSECGRALAERTVLVSFDRENTEAHKQMSLAADARIAWGGQEAVEAIRDLPCHWDCEDIVLGPRISYAVVDPDLLSDRVLDRLSIDIAYFDQMACSSPQCVFVRGKSDLSSIDAFVERFAAAFKKQAQSIRRHTLDFGETYQIELDRTRVLLEGGSLRHDKQTDWTIAIAENPNRELACVNRFVQIVPFERLEEVYPHIPRNIQTIITLLAKPDQDKFTEHAALRGVCRFPRPGEGNNFEIPWDGLAMVSRLTRWIVRSEAGKTAS